jgi:hypothetical protein
MDCLIDLKGNTLDIGAHDVDRAVSKRGFVHIRPIDRSVVAVTLQPKRLTSMAAVSVGYALGELQPEWTLVITSAADPICSLYRGHRPATLMLIELSEHNGDSTADPPVSRKQGGTPDAAAGELVRSIGVD